MSFSKIYYFLTFIFFYFDAQNASTIMFPSIENLKKQTTFTQKLALASDYFARSNVNKFGGEYDNPWVNNVPAKFNAFVYNEINPLLAILPPGALPMGNNITYLAAYKYDAQNKAAFTDVGCRYTQCYPHNGVQVITAQTESSAVKRFFAKAAGFGKVGGFQNHFQGIARGPEYLGLGNYFFITGNNWRTDANFGPQAHLFVIKMGTQKRGLFPAQPSKTNCIQKVINMTADFPNLTHPGGVQMCGKYFTTAMQQTDPVEKIVFYQIKVDTSDNVQVEPIKTASINYSAMNSSITRLYNGHFLIAGLGAKLTFFYSRTCAIEDGFDLAGAINASGYQSVNFINDADGSLYLLGTYNNDPQTPYYKKTIFHTENHRGTDIADLYKIGMPAKISKITDPSSSGGFTLTKIQSKIFPQITGYNFAAAAGIYIPNPTSLIIYSAPHWLVGLSCQKPYDVYLPIVQFS